MPKTIFDRIQKKRVRVDPETLAQLEEGGQRYSYDRRVAKKFEKGDIVRYTGKFLRNIGMQRGGPINGEVQGASGSFVKVLWSDATEPVFVHPVNIELDPRHRKKTANDSGVTPCTSDQG